MREEKTVLCKRLDRIGLRKFWNEVNELFEEGYRFDPNETSRRKTPICHNVVRVTLVRGEDEKIEKPEEKIDEEVTIEADEQKETEPKEVDLDSLRKKAELLEFAKANDIIIPDEEKFKYPANIKKYLKEILED